MRTIAIINQKGGCGKTTTAINLAAVIANQGRKTLLVDMDPQSHCALGLAVPDQQLDKTIADALRAGLDGTLPFSDIIWQISHHLDLAPSNMTLAALEQEMAGAPDRDRRLAQILTTVGDQYEFCIVDCPPSIGLLTFNALRAAHEVIVPVETGYFSLQGAVRQQQTIEMLARRVGHRVRFKVLATMYDVRTKLAREILGELRRHFADKLLPVVVHFNSKLKEAASFGQAITEYDPASTGYQDFEQLAQWLYDNPPTDLLIEGTAAAALAQPGTAGANPALSRAAELVERARALAARTAALSRPAPAVAPVGPDANGPMPAGDRGQDGIAGTIGGGSAGVPSPALPPAAPERSSPAFLRPAASFMSPVPSPVRQPPVASPGARSVPIAAGPALVQARPATTDLVPAAGPSTAVATTPPVLARPVTVEVAPALPAEPAAPIQMPAAASKILREATADDLATDPAAPVAKPLPAEAAPRLAEKLARLYGVRITNQGVLFLQPLGTARSMHVAGDFNNWNPHASPLKRDERLSVWQACIPIAPGRYRYRLVIDGKWVQDPHNSYVESNPFGELNNVIEVN